MCVSPTVQVKLRHKELPVGGAEWLKKCWKAGDQVEGDKLPQKEHLKVQANQRAEVIEEKQRGDKNVGADEGEEEPKEEPRDEIVVQVEQVDEHQRVLGQVTGPTAE